MATRANDRHSVLNAVQQNPAPSRGVPEKDKGKVLVDLPAQNSALAISCADHLESGNVLDRIKARTADQHRDLEIRLNLFRRTFSLQDYATLLFRLYGFYRPWEERVWPMLTSRSPSLVRGRRKLPLIIEDLQNLKARLENDSVNLDLPPLATFAQAMGSFYVLEGATLGGQILARHFERTLGLGPQMLSFFRGYGEKTGAMWKSFRQNFLVHVKLADEDAAVFAATKTFESLAGWLIQPEIR